MEPVVGAAILRRGCVLAARRTSPPSAAGRWEFPGGKVEPGERPAEALVREIAEELGCVIEVTGWLAGSANIGDTHVLTVATAVLLEAEPTPVEHDEVRWLAPEELDDVDWLGPDRPFLPELRSILLDAKRRAGGHRARGIFFEEDHARAAASRLRRDGYDATVVRERLAGEDDDDGHPWAVLTGAPTFALELLIDEYDGWLDDDDAPDQLDRSEPPAPLDLPTEPKRIKRS